MLDQNSVSFLQTAMSHELKYYQQLFELLAQEQRSLEKQNTSDMSQLLSEKAQLLDELEQSASRRLNVLGIKILQKQHHRLFEQAIENHQALTRQWAELKELMFRCQTQNEVNGRIIKLSQQSVERAINIFKQSLRPNNLTTYSAKGLALQTQLFMSSAKA